MKSIPNKLTFLYIMSEEWGQVSKEWVEEYSDAGERITKFPMTASERWLHFPREESDWENGGGEDIGARSCIALQA